MLESDVIIRQAEPRDIPSCAEGLLAFYETLGVGPNMRPTGLGSIAILADLAMNHVFLVADVDGCVAGAIAGRFCAMQFRPDKTLLCEVFWLTDPRYRGKGIGRKLLDAYVSMGSHVDAVTMTLEHNTELPNGYLEGLGFVAQETIYLKHVPDRNGDKP